MHNGSSSVVVALHRTEKCTTTWSTSWRVRTRPPCPITTSQRSFTGEQTHTSHPWVMVMIILLSQLTVVPSFPSKPLTPTTQSSKALPFIKVIEIKSWEGRPGPNLMYIYTYLSTPSCINYWFVEVFGFERLMVTKHRSLLYFYLRHLAARLMTSWLIFEACSRFTAQSMELISLAARRRRLFWHWNHIQTNQNDKRSRSNFTSLCL